MERSSGILMPISSLPSPYGIGTLGQAAMDFVDFLHGANQRWWQILPVGHTSYGDSPYQCLSAYAGNPYFVDLDLLIQDGLLKRKEVEELSWGEDPAQVDYATLYKNRFPLLKKAARRGWERDQAEVEVFCRANGEWLPDYALFMALKQHFGMAAWTQWPDEAIRLRERSAMERYRKELEKEIRFYTYIQFLFFRQWEALRSYAHEKGVGIIGDLPIYVALDSADVWAEPENFQLDENNLPTKVSGVPPDYFNENGQLWGNPLYDYAHMEKSGYGWWIRRIGGAAKLYDVIRIDHFRGFESYWAVPYGEATAKNGRWVKGPGMALVGVLSNWFKDLQFIAEDLGYPTAEVAQLLKDSGFPGMKVMEFSFDPGSPGEFLHTYIPHSVCYTGTHDNAPLAAWKETARPEEIALATDYLGLNQREGFNWGILRGGMACASELFVAQLQDYLELGAPSRMNTPGILGGNWQWRLLPGQLTPALTRRVAAMTKRYGRSV